MPHKKKADKGGKCSRQLTNEQHQTQREDEAEDRHLCIVAGTRQVPLIEKLDQWRKKRCQQEQERSDLEKTFHLISISPTRRTAKSAGSWRRRPFICRRESATALGCAMRAMAFTQFICIGTASS